MSTLARRLGTAPLPAAVALLAGLVACASPGGRPPAAARDPARIATLETRAAAIVGDAATEREKAIRLYDFVRDRIEFGFTPRFDDADPLYTLRVGRGHCNPQTALMVALARAAGLEARHHFVTISDSVLDGIWPRRAPRRGFLDHSFAEIRVEGRWLRVDGYALDARLYDAARHRLEVEERELGYAAHRDACREWDGASDCMAQFADPAMLLAGGDHGSFDDPARFYASDAYRQRLGGVSRFLYRWFGVRAMNRELDELREQAPADAGTPTADHVRAEGR